MKKVKVFYAHMPGSTKVGLNKVDQRPLEEQINEFVSSERVEIFDIKYQMYGIFISALLIYEEK